MLSLSIIVLLGLLVIATHRYDNRARPAKLVTVEEALGAEKEAKQTMREHDAVNAAALLNANNQITTLTSHKATLCQQIKTAKLPQPLCL